MPTIDTERFRLRHFVQRLVDDGECEVRSEPVDLIDVAAALDGNPRAVLFKAAGPERVELVGNVMGSRKRLALALDTDERGLLATLSKRLSRLQPPVKVSSQQAPVQQVVLKDDEADLTALPVHLQHGAVHFGRHRLCALSGQRLHQCGLPPHHAARTAARRRRSDRAERHARYLSARRRAR